MAMKTEVLIMLRMVFSVLLSLFLIPSYATQTAQPLTAEKAFMFSTHLNPKNQLILEWQMMPGYYLYKDRFQITSTPNSELTIEKPILPVGKTKKDDVFGTYQIYSGNVKIPVIVKAAKKQGILNLDISYQGCSAQGFCYAAQKKTIRVNLNPATDNANSNNIVVMGEVHPQTQQSYAESVFDDESDIVIIITFLGLGLLLAFTPCVLPMIPILSGIILGHKHMTTTKAFLLSLVYVLGMAITYAVAGIVVALIGSRIQTIFQSTWAIVFISGLFILLALSLFGFYELELPSRWRKRLTALSNQQKGGTYAGVFLMGVLSSLIVSPCVSAPLVGVLAYIADSGDVVLGGFALLALGIGMGIPLILVGISAGKFLPKSGPWMESIKKLFGILLLGIAIHMLSRIISGPLALFLWAILLICTAMFMGVFSEVKNNFQKLIKGLGFVLLIYGVILIIGSVLGNTDPLRPWEGSKIVASRQSSFVTLKNMQQLDEQLAAAKRNHKPVMLDFYADWCSSCIRLDHEVLSQLGIQSVLSDYVLLRADLTKNDDFDQALLKRFNVIAPPTILFFSPEGQELKMDRIVGEVSKEEFLKHLQSLN
jgi:thiol:disulfide interchange protein DsbD